MSLRTFALLALSAVAFAHPKRHIHHHHTGTGTGTGGFMRPTGGPFAMHNETDGSDFGAGSSSIPVEAVTFTVVPLAASSTTPVVAAAASSPNVAVDAVNQIEAGTEVAAVTSSACKPSSTFTSTITSVQYYSVTVTGANNDEAVAVPTSEFFALSSAATPSTTTTLSLSTTASVAAGDFFQHPSFGGSGFSSSAAAFSAVPTTFATSMLSSAAAGTSAPASTGTTTPSISTSGQKGLSYNIASLTDAFSGAGISWAYNWAASPGGTILSGAEYVPMLWGSNSISGWSAAAASAIASGSTHLLSFNEPDLPAQSNLSPSEAASLHIANMNPLAGSAQIGSPAITNGQGTSPAMGIDWLNQFFTACDNNCKVDFVAFHYYNDASQIEDFKSHVADVIAAAAQQGISNVWLTEFGASGSDADVSSFLSEALTFLDSTAGVQRYAYFMASDGILLSGNALSPLGEVYAS